MRRIILQIITIILFLSGAQGISTYNEGFDDNPCSCYNYRVKFIDGNRCEGINEIVHSNGDADIELISFVGNGMPDFNDLDKGSLNVGFYTNKKISYFEAREIENHRQYMMSVVTKYIEIKNNEWNRFENWSTEILYDFQIKDIGIVINVEDSYYAPAIVAVDEILDFSNYHNYPCEISNYILYFLAKEKISKIKWSLSHKVKNKRRNSSRYIEIKSDSINQSFERNHAIGIEIPMSKSNKKGKMKLFNKGEYKLSFKFYTKPNLSPNLENIYFYHDPKPNL